MQSNKQGQEEEKAALLSCQKALPRCSKMRRWRSPLKVFFLPCTPTFAGGALLFYSLYRTGGGWEYVCDCSVVTLIACLGRKRLTSQGTWEENRSQSPDFLATWLLRLDCFAELSQRWCGKPEFLEITRYDSKRVTMFKTTAGWWKILSRSCKLLQITC